MAKGRYDGPPLLTPHELYVVRCLAEGHHPKKIAHALRIGVHGVYSIISTICNKFGLQKQPGIKNWRQYAVIVAYLKGELNW